MNFKFYFAGFYWLPLLLVGCASNREKIEFSDTYQPVQASEVAVPRPEPGLNKSELAQIEMEIFSHLLARHFGDDEHFSAVFISGEESRTEALIQKFPQHIPPIKAWWHLDQRPGLSPLDRDTGRPAILLSADVADPEAGRVLALGKWFAGDSVAGFYRFELKQQGGNWVIASVH